MSQAFARQPLTRLRPPRGWSGFDFTELVRFRNLFTALAVRDVKLRYKQTLLGIGWVVLQPLFTAGIFTFVFGVVAGMKTGSGGAYLMFSLTGLLVWNVFSSALTRSGLAMVGNAQLVTKVYFPRLILPLSSAGSTLVDFAIPASALVVWLLISGHPFSAAVALAPVWIALALLLALGLGLIAAALTIDYRDVQHMLPMLTPFLLYACPVAYDTSRVPERFRVLYHALNPLASLIEAFRWSMLGGSAPSAASVGYSATVSVLLFVLGATMFQRMERRVADVI